MELDVYMLTTVDNPYNPFTQYDEWRAYDEYSSRLTGRPTCESYVGSIARTSTDILPEDAIREVNLAIDSIVKLNSSGVYRKVGM